jgi:4-hydroxybenzoate polyprenyltransferase
VAAVAIALIAGGQAGVALRLGLGMLGLQFAIGAANDFEDAASDSVSKPDKPIPAGLLSRDAAAVVCGTAAALGLLAAATVGAGAFVVGVVGLADGLVYDLRLKRTPLAPIPFAAGVGLLPLYGWWGVGKSMPVALLGVVALAVVAGASLAVANAYADVDADLKSSTTSVATFLGARFALALNAVLLAGVQLVAIATTVVIGAAPPLLVVEAAGCGLGWLGLGLAGVRDIRVRPLVWEVQAVGMLVLGAAWLLVLDSAGLLLR